MTKRYRLLGRAQMHGEIREPGYEFTLADGERGPYRAQPPHIPRSRCSRKSSNMKSKESRPTMTI